MDLNGLLFAFDSPISVPGYVNGVLLPSVTFEVKVFTGDLRGNGTDGDLCVTLTGDKGKTPDNLKVCIPFGEHLIIREGSALTTVHGSVSRASQSSI